MSREEYSPNYFPFLRSYIDQVKSPDTEVELRGTRVGRIDSFRFFETLDWISILDSVIEAEQEGYDAVAIGNILDPALREARSMVDIPVLGLGETSMLTSCMMGSTFSLVGVNPYFGGRFEENVAKYGLRDRLASIECMGLTPHELDACFSDPDWPGEGDRVVHRGGSRLARQGRRGRHSCRRAAHGVPERGRSSARSTERRCSTARSRSSLPPRPRSASAGSPARSSAVGGCTQELPRRRSPRPAPSTRTGYHLPALRRLAADTPTTDKD